ncbi:hypothetical protein BH20ACI3_BH20ACI3_23950 [soil metagenome]
MELRQAGDSNTFEATDSSLLQLIERGASGALLRRPDGTQLTFVWIGGQLQCTEIKDRSGNFITASYNKHGHLSGITDTLGRSFWFNRDHGGNLLSITQERLGSKQHVLATFGYSSLTVLTNFAGLSVLGPANGTAITVLTQVGLADGTRYQFNYTSWGQVSRITFYAADGLALAYNTYNVPENAIFPLADCPRPTELRNWTRNSNDNAETVTRFEANGSWGQTTLPDGSTRKDFFGTGGWQRGLTVRTEERAANGALQKSTSTEWVEPEEGADRIVPRSQETIRVDVKGNQQRTRTEYTSYGLPKDVYDYAGATLLRRTHSEYNLDRVYVERRIIGLVSEQVTYDANGAVSAKTSRVYDLADGLVDQGSAIQHDNASYGLDFVVGRGLVGAIRRWDPKDPNNESKVVETRMGYNTTGSIAFMRDSSGRQTNVSYTDNFADGKDRRTMAFATKAIHYDGRRTSTQFNYDIGALVRNESAQGDVNTFTHDAAGRMTLMIDEKTGAYARRVYAESGTLVATFMPVKPTTKEFGRYTVYDGAKRVRARAMDPLSRGMGYRGLFIIRDIMGRPLSRSKPTRMSSGWVAAEPVAMSPSNPSSQRSAIQLLAAGVERFNERVLAGLDELMSAVGPTAQAQDCYDEYYGECEEPDGNDWFYGGEWGQDWYWDWTDFADALVWGDSQYWYSSDWDTLSYLAQLSDYEFEIQLQWANSGYFSSALWFEWDGGGYH